MHIILNLQEAAKSRESFINFLQDSCDATVKIVKNNMFSDKGKKQLKEIQNKMKEMKK